MLHSTYELEAYISLSALLRDEGLFVASRVSTASPDLIVKWGLV